MMCMQPLYFYTLRTLNAREPWTEAGTFQNNWGTQSGTAAEIDAIGEQHAIGEQQLSSWGAADKPGSSMHCGLWLILPTLCLASPLQRSHAAFVFR